MKIRLRYFASLRESLGAGEVLEVPDGLTTVGQVREHLVALGDPHATALARGRALRAALNQTLCTDTTALEEGAELAFFPPVTGG